MTVFAGQAEDRTHNHGEDWDKAGNSNKANEGSKSICNLRVNFISNIIVGKTKKPNHSYKQFGFLLGHTDSNHE